MTTAERCGYCADDPDPDMICRPCFDQLDASDTPRLSDARALRSRGLDALRGLAVVFMVADHLALFAGAPLVRVTVGRLAMPLFFVLAGHLATRLSWRVARLGLLGVLLPLAAPWVDSPNVLLWLAYGAVALALARRAHLPPALLVGAQLAVFANPGVFHPYADLGTGYPPAALLGLMALGAMLHRDQLTGLADRLPARLVPPLSWAGRHALGLYVGHVLLLTVCGPLLLGGA